MIITKSIMFFISFIGLVILFKEQFKIKTEFIPVFLISTIICILNISGLLGDLRYTSYVIYYFGFVSIIYNLIRRKLIKNIVELSKNAAFITFFIFIIILSVLLFDMHFSHYDNFSHWALVVKEILCFDSMPQASSAELMHFTGYPLGSALFIYYCCKIIGVSEGIMLIVQGAFIVSCMLPLFAYDGKFKASKIPIIIIMYLLLLIEPKVFNLLVDVLLACLGFASLMIIIYYRKEVRKAFLVSLPTVIALVLVKNSGVFFAVINILLLLYFAIKSGNVKRNIKYSIILSLSVVATVLVWNMHCDAVFPEVVGKHSMRGSNFKSILGEKTFEDIKIIAILMKDKLRDTNNMFIKAMIAVNIVAFSGRVWRKFAQEREYKITRVALVLDATFIVYYIGIFFMYVFSMPMEEASYLAGFSRYIATIVLYIVLIFTAYWVYITNYDKPSTDKPNRYGMVFLIGFVIIATSILGNGNYNVLRIRNEYKNTYPNNAIMHENFDKTDESYVMYVPEVHRDYYQTAYFNYLMKYKMFTGSCYPFLIGDLEKPYDENVIELIHVYDNFIIYEEDEFIQNFAEKYLDKKENIVGIYKVKDYFNKQ